MYSTFAQANKDQNLIPFRFALKAYLQDERLKIPVLPDVVGKVIALINHPRADAYTLARLIHKDQALAGYVMRVSNSPIFAGTHEITTLRQAIARIGAKTLGKIALSVTMQGKVFQAPGYEDEIRDIWRKTLTAGAFAQDIGHLLGETSESLYLCGLLHTVGKPVILHALNELKKELKMDLSVNAGILLMDEFHQAVGQKVAIEWKLPLAVREACLYYTDPEKARKFPREVCITFLAHQFALFIDRYPDKETLMALSRHEATLRLGLKPGHLATLAGRLDRTRALLDAMTMHKAVPQ